MPNRHDDRYQDDEHDDRRERGPRRRDEDDRDPSPRRGRDDDDLESDERIEARRRRRDEEDEDDDDDGRPRRRRRRDDDDDYDIGQDAGMRMVLPVGQSGWAIVSGYLGLVSVLVLPAPFAVWTGILAIRDMKRNKKKHGMGRAVSGIGCGSIVMVGLAVILILSATGLIK